MVPIRALLPRSTPRAVRVSSLPFRRIHTSSAGRAPARANIPDYYQLLAPHLSDAPLAAKWALDTAALKSAWRKAQAVTHPDRMLNASPEEQEQAATRSALVNRAYETLREPLPRATYLVGLSCNERSHTLQFPFPFFPPYLYFGGVPRRFVDP